MVRRKGMKVLLKFRQNCIMVSKNLTSNIRKRILIGVHEKVLRLKTQGDT